MTVKEQIIRRVLDMNDAQAERLRDQIEPSVDATNGRHVPPDGSEFHDSEWRALVREAQAMPPEERTPFQDGLVLRAAREAELANTPEGRAELERNRRDRERIAGAPPLDENHPIWAIVGMASSAEPTDIANHKDEYIADAIEHGWK